MIYDKLPVVLLSVLESDRHDSINAHIARYLLAHTSDAAELSVKKLAAACSVGIGSVSRFCRNVGFADFEELREALLSARFDFELASTAADFVKRSEELAFKTASSLYCVARSVDESTLQALVDDLRAYERVSAFGLLKAESAAINLQVDMLMQGKQIETCVRYDEQLSRIASAGSDQLVVVFSYTGSYFDRGGMDARMRHLPLPKIWVVCGQRRPLPNYVGGCLLFDSQLNQLSHPYQLELAAGLIAQEYARKARA